MVEAAQDERRDLNDHELELVTKAQERIAEVNERMQEARKQSDKLLEDDDVHLSQAGYRVM